MRSFLPRRPTVPPTAPAPGCRFSAMELFNRFGDPGGGFETLARAGHILTGLTWIGLLYFFNYVQTPAFAQMSDGARSEAMRKITFRALWWFRWAAAATVIFGAAHHLGAGDERRRRRAIPYWSGQKGTAILTGILFGLTSVPERVGAMHLAGPEGHHRLGRVGGQRRPARPEEHAGAGRRARPGRRGATPSSPSPCCSSWSSPPTAPASGGGRRRPRSSAARWSTG